MEGFMTVNEAASLRHLSTGHVRQLCIDGKLKGAHKMGKQWVIPEKSIREYQPAPKGFTVIWANRRKSAKAELMNALKENEARAD